jgi:hypothetical protein
MEYHPNPPCFEPTEKEVLFPLKVFYVDVGTLYLLFFG